MQLTLLETDHAAGVLVKSVTDADWSTVKDETTREKWRTLAKNMAAMWGTERSAETLGEFYKWCAVKLPSPPPERKPNAGQQNKAGST